MNKIIITGKIMKSVFKEPDHLWLVLNDYVTPGKKVQFSTNIKGSDAIAWNNELREGDHVTVRGNVACVRQNQYGGQIDIYNPVIVDAFREQTETIKLVADKTNVPSDDNRDIETAEE